MFYSIAALPEERELHVVDEVIVRSSSDLDDDFFALPLSLVQLLENTIPPR
jgi:hypothetical protein